GEVEIGYVHVRVEGEMMARSFQRAFELVGAGERSFCAEGVGEPAAFLRDTEVEPAERITAVGPDRPAEICGRRGEAALMCFDHTEIVPGRELAWQLGYGPPDPLPSRSKGA